MSIVFIIVSFVLLFIVALMFNLLDKRLKKIDGRLEKQFQKELDQLVAINKYSELFYKELAEKLSCKN